MSIGLADSLGKILGDSRFMAKIVPISFPFVLASNLFIVICYFHQDGFYKTHQKLLWILNSCLIFTFSVRNGSAVVYFMNKIKKDLKKSHPDIEGDELDEYLRKIDPEFSYLGEETKKAARDKFHE